MQVFWLGADICIVAFLVAVITHGFIDITVLVLFLLLLLDLSCIGDISQGSTSSYPLFMIPFFFFFLQTYSKSSLVFATQNKMGFTSFTLGLFKQEFLTFVFWLYIFEAMLLKRWWSLEQRISGSWTMVLDFKPALTSTLTVFYIISLKFMNFWSCYSILILMENLRFFRK